MIYYEDPRTCDARSNVIYSVEGCSKGVFDSCWVYGKSPWFSRFPVLSAVSVGWRVLFSLVVDGGFFLD